MKNFKEFEESFLTSSELEKAICLEAVKRQIEKREAKNLQFARRLKKAKLWLCTLILVVSGLVYFYGEILNFHTVR